MEKKTCKMCARSLELAAFPISVRRGNNKPARRGVCKDCFNKKRQKNPEPDFEITIDPEVTAPLPPEHSYSPPPAKTDAVAKTRNLERVLVIPDTHVPYHDERAWQVMLAAAKDFKPDRIVILGDFMDCYSVSFHAKDPKRKNDLKWEIEQGCLKIDDLDALGAKSKHYIMGNHEDRLDRFLAQNASALANLLSFEEELGLKERGWQVTPYKQGVKIGKVNFTHDTGSAGANAHRQSMNTYHSSVIIGHTHRLAYEVAGSADGAPLLYAMLGWLGDGASIDYTHRQFASRNWVHGFGLGFIDSDGIVYLQPVPIVNYKCTVHGVRYAANW